MEGDNTKFIDLEFLQFKDEDIEYICSKDSEITKLTAAFEVLYSSDIVGLDSEWVKGKAPVQSCLIQTATRKKAFIFDFYGTKVGMSWMSCPKFDKEFEYCLLRLFINDKILKVAWDFDLDLKNINNRFGNRLKVVANFVDLMPYHPKELPKGFSSSFENHFGRRLDKSSQNSDWSNRPLDMTKITYCAIDAIAAVVLYDKMKESLELTQFDLLLKDVNKRMADYRDRKKQESLIEQLSVLNIK
jgi:ribonuclease D